MQAVWCLLKKCHYGLDCPKKENNKSMNSVNVEETDSNGDGVFAVDVTSDDCSSLGLTLDLKSMFVSDISMPGLQSVSKSDLSTQDDVPNTMGDTTLCEGEDWFSEVGSGVGDFEDLDWEENSNLILPEPMEGLDEVNKDILDEISAILDTSTTHNAPMSGIYDSGATKHISPICTHLILYRNPTTHSACCKQSQIQCHWSR